jgi:hypothetical protein
MGIRFITRSRPWFLRPPHHSARHPVDVAGQRFHMFSHNFRRAEFGEDIGAEPEQGGIVHHADDGDGNRVDRGDEVVTNI